MSTTTEHTRQAAELTSTMCRRSRTYFRSLSMISATTRPLCDDDKLTTLGCRRHLAARGGGTVWNVTTPGDGRQSLSKEQSRCSRQQSVSTGGELTELVGEWSASRWSGNWEDDNDDDEDEDTVGEGGAASDVTRCLCWQSSAPGVEHWLDMASDNISEDRRPTSSLLEHGWEIARLYVKGQQRAATCRSSGGRWCWLARSWSKAVSTVEPRLSDDPAIDRTSNHTGQVSTLYSFCDDLALYIAWRGDAQRRRRSAVNYVNTQRVYVII